MDETIKILVDQVQKVAPEVWSTLLRQAIMEGAGMSLFAMALIVAIVAIWRRIDRGFTADIAREEERGFSQERADMARMFRQIMGVIFCLVLIFAAMDVVKGLYHLINPEFYAIQYLIEAVR